MFSCRPVERSSRRMTWSPLVNKWSARWEPIKPAPPVISAFTAMSLMDEHRLPLEYSSISINNGELGSDPAPNMGI